MNKKLQIFTISALLLFFSGQLYAQTLKAYLNAGDLSMNKSRYAEAIEYYKKALEFETDDPVISFKMAEASRLYKDYERAAAWYGKIVSADRENAYPMALFRFAEMKKYLGMYDESCRIYERYILNNQADTGYFMTKAMKEFNDCDMVKHLALKEANVEAENAGAPVNSIYSEFGASMMGDTTLYFSSLKFVYEQTDKKQDAYYVSRIMTSDLNSKKSMKPEVMGILFNDAPTHNGNVAFSPDYKVMIFSRCTQPEGNYDLHCNLYMSTFSENKWNKPVKLNADINSESFSSTQPAIRARGADGYTLYFISDREGGYGKLDIWVSDFDAGLNFDSVYNAGPIINTFDDEMTPFFDTPNSTLYFSSYGHINLGGFDIFKSVLVNKEFSDPENLGTVYNTSVNDVYFTVNRDGKSGTLSSNRHGSMYIKSRTCCYDIYYYQITEPEIDSVIAETPDTHSTDSLETAIAKADPGNKAYYDDFLPLQLYFDNDEPDKRTMATTTKKSYDKLYSDYISRIEDYKSNFGKDDEGSNNLIDKFFNEHVTASWNLLNGFCEKVEKALENGVGIELEVRGRTSPLADNAYNVNLSRRRIASLVNYMNAYNNGVLKPYFESGQLKITQVPAGESLVQSGVSDMLSDKRNSVYNPSAAIERRIELINVNLVQPE